MPVVVMLLRLWYIGVGHTKNILDCGWIPLLWRGGAKRRGGSPLPIHKTGARKSWSNQRASFAPVLAMGRSKTVEISDV